MQNNCAKAPRKAATSSRSPVVKPVVRYGPPKPKAQPAPQPTVTVCTTAKPPTATSRKLFDFTEPQTDESRPQAEVLQYEELVRTGLVLQRMGDTSFEYLNAINLKDEDAVGRASADGGIASMVYDEFAWDEGDFEAQLELAKRVLLPGGTLALYLDSYAATTYLSGHLQSFGIYCAKGSKICGDGHGVGVGFHCATLYASGGFDGRFVLYLQKAETCPLGLPRSR